MSRLISIILSIFMMLSSWYSSFFGGEFKHDKKVDNNYPCVFVHGFMGFGQNSAANSVAAYWGAGSCDLIKELNDLGYDCYEADVGPISSTWDRACELYAQLVGATVDYGEAHSKEHSHARYGRTYTEPLLPNWGSADENGNTVKVNLLGHSFGGNTIRMLSALLADGDKAEMQSGAADVSDLFKGGKGDWVNSITTIASPNNGTTLTYIGEKIGLLRFVETVSYFMAGIAGRTDISEVFDFQLEQFGITPMPGEKTNDFLVRAISEMMENCNNDSSYYDLSPDGVKELNDRCEALDNVYYYCQPFSAVEKNSIGIYTVRRNTFGLLHPFCMIMSMYSENTVTDFVIDESWCDNDGMVNTISEKNPFDEPYRDFNFGMETAPGVWNVLPTREGDHGYAVGLMDKKVNILKYYTSLLDEINSNG